jgi:hypothetical protein
VIRLLALLVLLAPFGASAQTVLTAPQVAGCPSPVPPAWPASSCKYQFYPLTDTVHAIASVSKTAPVYQHTYGGYNLATTLLVACPIGATLSADTKQCTGPNGLDASALVAKSAIPTFATTFDPPVVTPPATVSVTIKPLATSDPPQTTVTYSALPAGSCFALSDGTHTTQACLPQ